jgi:hypothetical protein
MDRRGGKRVRAVGPDPPLASLQTSIDRIKRRKNLLSDLLAVGVFLLIQRLPFLLGNVSMVLFRHVAFFLTNFMIIFVKLMGLLFADFAILLFLIDASVLVTQPLVHFMAARMVLGEIALMLAVCGNRCANGEHKASGQSGNNGLSDQVAFHGGVSG